MNSGKINNVASKEEHLVAFLPLSNTVSSSSASDADLAIYDKHERRTAEEIDKETFSPERTEVEELQTVIFIFLGFECKNRQHVDRLLQRSKYLQTGA